VSIGYFGGSSSQRHSVAARSLARVCGNRLEVERVSLTDRSSDWLKVKDPHFLAHAAR
jgi:hypothetical protein